MGKLYQLLDQDAKARMTYERGMQFVPDTGLGHTLRKVHRALQRRVLQSTTRIDPLTKLPIEILSQILGYLRLHERVHLERVSKRWQQVAIETCSTLLLVKDSAGRVTHLPRGERALASTLKRYMSATTLAYDPAACGIKNRTSDQHIKLWRLALAKRNKLTSVELHLDLFGLLPPRNQLSYLRVVHLSGHQSLRDFFVATAALPALEELSIIQQDCLDTSTPAIAATSQYFARLLRLYVFRIGGDSRTSSLAEFFSNGWFPRLVALRELGQPLQLFDTRSWPDGLEELDLGLVVGSATAPLPAGLKKLRLRSFGGDSLPKLLDNGLPSLLELELVFDHILTGPLGLEILRAAHNVELVQLQFVARDLPTEVYASAIEELTRLRHVRLLHVSFLREEEKTLALLARLAEITGLQELQLHRCALSTPASIRTLVTQMPQIRKLRIVECVRFDPSYLHWFRTRFGDDFT